MHFRCIQCKFIYLKLIIKQYNKENDLMLDFAYIKIDCFFLGLKGFKGDIGRTGEIGFAGMDGVPGERGQVGKPHLHLTFYYLKQFY